MKNVLPNKERGVVMILILVFLTMFAIMISAFLFMTSNMSDSAANSLALYEKGETAADRHVSDIDSAIRTLVTGTNNEASPIGPFGILENLYGDLTVINGYDFLSAQSFNLYGEYDGVVPTRAYIDIFLGPEAGRYWNSCVERKQECDTKIDLFQRSGDPQKMALVPNLVKESDKLEEYIPARSEDFIPLIIEKMRGCGSHVSFGSLRWDGNDELYSADPQAQAYITMCKTFNQLVCGTSARIVSREFFNNATDGQFFRIEIALTEELKQFLTLCPHDSMSIWPSGEYSYPAAFNLAANIRLNPPAFSGTGAGGFAPETVLDGQLDAETASAAFFPGEDEGEKPAPARLPFAFWGNASAPDLSPYEDADGKISFQTFLRHLTDREFSVYSPAAGNRVFPNYDGVWQFQSGITVAPREPVRMNPGYTAVDQRNLFLAGLAFQDNKTKPTPSFVRPETLKALRTLLAAVSGESGRRGAAALLRKATPRPLRIDHWEWTGSNDGLLPSPYGQMTDDPETVKATALAELDALISADAEKKWDVDNDNDGIKDGIWIPSGQPIRADENGRPYATMYSFTVLDLDGRVNLNTAGNWDQLPYPGGEYYTRLTKEEDKSGIADLAEYFTSAYPNSPWYPFENLKAGIGWYDDADDEMVSEHLSRSSGLGPAGTDLTAAFAEMKFVTGKTDAGKDKSGAAAASVLGRRYRSNYFGSLSAGKPLPDPSGSPLFDGLEQNFASIADITLRGQLAQPSAYYAEPNSAARTDPSQWIPDDSDGHRRFYLHTDAVYRGDKTAALADPNLFLFPWRGKTRVFDYGASAGSPHYPKKYSSYPTFDFCDTALRSYDPLGNDILTYMPKYSENPYLVDPYGSSQKDATFTAETLELLLRPFDYDRKNRPAALLSALLEEKTADALDHPEKDEYRALRQEITTVSSDIPVPASAIPAGTAEVRDGVYGLRELIRRCVILEIYKANRESRFGESYVSGKKSQFTGETGVSAESEEGRAQFRAYLRSQIEDDIAKFKSGALEKITDQLFALLPRDIQEGRRLDLNALSRKASWIDSAYEDQGDGTYVKTLPAGTIDDATKEEYEYYHQLGIAERMKFARGLYVLLMALTYEDRNAETAAAFYDNDPDARLADEKTYKDYLEGCDKPYIDKLAATEGSAETADGKKARLAGELTANRLAQYCVNLVDFSDPDATMTPFFYDPNPFDGWWSYRDRSADWIYGNAQPVGDGETPPEHQGNDSFGFVLFTPGTNADDAERDFYDALIPAVGEDGSYSASFLSTPDAPISERCRTYINGDLPVQFSDAGDTFSQTLVSFLYGQSIDNPQVGKDDFGMRLVWGMERPDLLLTETLAFHDLGVADTSNDSSGKTVYGGEDEDFDQVRRPLGSAYLELYCAANPNVPQSPELYEFDPERNLWKLLLSKMTPRQKDDSPYKGQEFPVWRVAVTASTDPRGNEEKDKELTGTDEDAVPRKRTIRKTKNSVVERLVGEKADQRTFSFRTRQFCDLEIDSSGDKSPDGKLNEKWRGYDYTVASILGPCAEPLSDGTPDFNNEVEIDRIVWFGWPAKPGSSDFDAIGSYPDAAHIFCRVKETAGDRLETGIFPNQYLVVAPSEKRQIGSIYRGSSYFGVPSPRRIVMTKLREANSGKWTASDYILAGTYNGLDINSDDKFEVNKRGFNISEPLWTEATDPYPNTIPTKDITYEGETVTVTDLDGRNNVPDQIFELPADDHKNDRYPIAADHLAGLGTVPGIRSAFVQRVADPNRPYHPFANPYISVDWNMMDLTVFNGESAGSGDSQTDERFYTADDSDEVDEKNRLKVKFLSTDMNLDFETDTTNTKSVFSSRAWLDPEQKGFLPEDLAKDRRPNPWARPVNKDELKKAESAGLRAVASNSSVYSNLTDLYDGLPTDLDPGAAGSGAREPVVHIFPRHTLGAYNNAENRVTSLGGQFEGAENAGGLRKLYYGAPSRDGSEESFQPFEFLAWNDAPFSSPAELLLVPASMPGRFGLEFIRHKNVKDAEDGNGFELSVLYTEGKEDDKYGRLGRSLGSDGGSGANLFGWETDSVLTGPYLNFHHTSGVKGESLNLSGLFDFVTVPSLYMGTRIFCGCDHNGDPIYTPALREPGKINLNTMKESGWKGILGNDSKVTEFAKFSETRKTPFEAGSSAALNIDPEVLAKTGKSEGEEEDGEESKAAAPGDVTLLRNGLLDRKGKKNNMLTATDELRKLAGLTTNRSNVFAVWLTVGYFEVERARPGVNMPLCDPDGNSFLNPDPATGLPLVDAAGYLALPPGYKYYDYYRVIYPDGYTYGKELGTDGVDTDGISRPRAFYLIDRSIPVDFRRGRSWNWKNVILLERKL